MATINENLLPYKIGYKEFTATTTVDQIKSLNVQALCVIGFWNQASGDQNHYQNSGSILFFTAGGYLYYIIKDAGMGGRTIGVYYLKP